MSRIGNVLRQPVIAASALLAAILAMTGAFDTFRIVLPLRLAYWLLSIGAGAGFLWLVRRVGPRTSFRLLNGALVTIGAALPATVVAWGLGVALFSAPASLPRLFGLFPAVVVVNGLLLALWRLTERRETIVRVEAEAPPDDIVPETIAARLPPRLARSRLVAIEAQDHYLRVATRDGDALIHMRFADALATLARSDGARVHRSWWVARCAINDATWTGGRGQLRLCDDAVVPVSRTFAEAAKAMSHRPRPGDGHLERGAG